MEFWLFYWVFSWNFIFFVDFFSQFFSDFFFSTKFQLQTWNENYPNPTQNKNLIPAILFSASCGPDALSYNLPSSSRNGEKTKTKEKKNQSNSFICARACRLTSLAFHQGTNHFSKCHLQVFPSVSRWPAWLWTWELSLSFPLRTFSVSAYSCTCGYIRRAHGCRQPLCTHCPEVRWLAAVT